MTQKLYSIDVQICATAYVKAGSPEEAAEKVRALNGDGIEVDGGMIDGREFSRLMADADPDSDVTISPAMTIGKQAYPLIETAYDPEE